eukprot:394092-Pelagomonas_calceolata.AAC.1
MVTAPLYSQSAFLKWLQPHSTAKAAKQEHNILKHAHNPLQRGFTAARSRELHAPHTRLLEKLQDPNKEHSVQLASIAVVVLKEVGHKELPEMRFSNTAPPCTQMHREAKAH